MDLTEATDEELALELAERLEKKTSYHSPIHNVSMPVSEFVELAGREPKPDDVTEEDDPDDREVMGVTSLQLYLDKRTAGELIFDPDGRLISCTEITF